jgi:hypothetical protein
LGRRICEGIVSTVRGQLVLFTGKTYVHGKQAFRPALHQEVRDLGGKSATDVSRAVTLLVLGDLGGQKVVDPINQRSQKLVYVDEQRRTGNHICVIDEDGYTAIAEGESAPCLRTTLIGGENGHEVIEVSPPSASAALVSDQTARVRIDVLGTPLGTRRLPDHADTRLEEDLSYIDRATAAHEEVIRKLKVYLELSGIALKSPGPDMPMFDAGWSEGQDASKVDIAEVKSLTGTVQAQQIRLGLGQILDYAHAVRAALAGQELTIVPVLILQHEPADGRWASLAQSLDVVLTWPPAFQGL